MPVLPVAAIENMSEAAAAQLLSSRKNLPFDTYSSVTYEGVNGGVPVTGLFVEVDSNTWVENDLFTFAEVSETADSVVLYDSSRDLTVTMNFETNELIITFNDARLTWEVTGVTQSFTPVIPEGWLF